MLVIAGVPHDHDRRIRDQGTALPKSSVRGIARHIGEDHSFTNSAAYQPRLAITGFFLVAATYSKGILLLGVPQRILALVSRITTAHM